MFNNIIMMMAIESLTLCENSQRTRQKERNNISEGLLRVTAKMDDDKEKRAIFSIHKKNENYYIMKGRERGKISYGRNFCEPLLQLRLFCVCV
jgi:hypothetical protein